MGCAQWPHSSTGALPSVHFCWSPSIAVVTLMAQPQVIKPWLMHLTLMDHALLHGGGGGGSCQVLIKHFYMADFNHSPNAHPPSIIPWCVPVCRSWTDRAILQLKGSVVYYLNKASDITQQVGGDAFYEGPALHRKQCQQQHRRTAACFHELLSQSCAPNVCMMHASNHAQCLSAVISIPRVTDTECVVLGMERMHICMCVCMYVWRAEILPLFRYSYCTQCAVCFTFICVGGYETTTARLFH